MVRLSLVLAAVVAAITLVLALIWFGTKEDTPPGAEAVVEADNATFSAIEPQAEFVEGVARHWLDAAVTENGFYRSRINRQWQPMAEQKATLASQSRLIHVFATAHDLSGDAAFRQAVQLGAEFLISYFPDPAGGWRAGVRENGAALEGAASPLAVAEAILALADAYRVTGDERFRDAALLAWQENTEAMLAIPRLAAQDGYGELLGLAVPPAPQNLMQLMEALLVLHDVTGDNEVWRDAEAIAKFVFKDLAANSEGWVGETYDRSLQPVAADAIGPVNISHQMKWAYLISRAVDKGLSNAFLPAANTLIDKALERGVDRSGGGVFGRLIPGEADTEVRVKPASAQAEALRTLAHYAAARGRADLWPHFDRIYGFVQQAIVDDEFGGWLPRGRDGLELSSTAPAKSAGGSMGSHEAGLYGEIARLQKLARE